MSISHIRIVASLALALATFSGRLVDRTTGQPLVRVEVRATGPSRAHALTDGRGRFDLGHLRPGAYTLWVESNDVPQQHFHVKVAGQSAPVTIKACSTTLDYHCGMPDQGGGPG